MGRTALVTGAGSETGIGFSAARIMGQQGCQVAITSTTERIFNRAETLTKAGAKAKGYIADLMHEGAVAQLVEWVIADFGAIDILVNNAGMVQVGQDEGASKPFAQMDAEVWHESIKRNLTTCFDVTRAVLPGMIARGYGRIVNVSSVTGPLVNNPHGAAYGASKAAIMGMSRAIAIEVGGKGITINNVAPGWIATGSQTPPEAIGGQHTPLGRSGTPEEVGDLIAFLASDEATYITGQLIVIDGGNTIQEYKGPTDGYY